MQHETLLRKWTDIKGIAAVTIDTGSKVGTVEDFLFDPQRNILLAFVIKTGLFSQRILLANAVNAVGVDALTFANEAALLKERGQGELQNALLGQSLLAYRILSKGGNLVGTVGNLILDITTPTAIHITTFELAGGLREAISHHHLSFAADQLLNYGQDVLVIPDSVAQTLQRQ